MPYSPGESLRLEVIFACLCGATGLLGVFDPTALELTLALSTLGLLTSLGRNHPEPALFFICMTALTVASPLGPIVAVVACSVALLSWILIRLALGRLKPARPRRALVGLALLIGFSVDFALRTPATTPGQFVAFESFSVIGIATLVSLLPTLGRRAEAWVTCGVATVGAVASLSVLIAVEQNTLVFDKTRQVSSLFGGSNYVAAAAGLSACLLVSWAVGTDRTPLSRVVAAVGAPFFIAVIVVMASRPSTIALGAALLLIAARASGVARVILVTSVGLFGLAATSSGVTSILQTRLQADFTNELADRQFLWSVGWSRFLDSPLFGGGLAINADRFSSVGLTYYVHNAPIEWLSRLGAIGGIVAYLFILTPTTLISTSRMSSAMAFALIVGLFEPSIETLRIGTLIVVITATIVTVNRRERSTRHEIVVQPADAHDRGVPLGDRRLT